MTPTNDDLDGDTIVEQPAPVDRAAAGLTTTERDMLRYALELAQDQMHSRGDEFTDDDQAAVDKLRRMADEAQQPTPRQWCKCPSCWGWFVEDHPGEDLNDLGKDLGWWSGLPEHRDAPADEAPRPETHAAPGQPCTCADAGDCFAPVGHYADCPQAAVSQPGKEA